MAKIYDVQLTDLNKMIAAFKSESDRGAAVLAGGHVDNGLAMYLKWRVRNKEVSGEVFGGFGPLSSFHQRIVCAYAFGFIEKSDYEDLMLIKDIRNHFAHHPFDTTFSTDYVGERVKKLSTVDLGVAATASTAAERNRWAYLIACSMRTARLHMAMGKKSMKGGKG